MYIYNISYKIYNKNKISQLFYFNYFKIHKNYYINRVYIKIRGT